jgi:hypothetical protein
MQKLDLLRLLRLLRHVLKLDGAQSLRWANGDTVQLFGVRFSLTYLRGKRFKDPRLLFRYAEGFTKETILAENSNDFSGLGAILCLLTEELSMSSDLRTSRIGNSDSYIGLEVGWTTSTGKRPDITCPHLRQFCHSELAQLAQQN